MKNSPVLFSLVLAGLILTTGCGKTDEEADSAPAAEAGSTTGAGVELPFDDADASPSAAGATPQTQKKTDPLLELAGRLKRQREELIAQKVKRQTLLAKRISELNSLTADLQSRIRRAGLTVDAVLSQFKQAVPDTGTLAELFVDYRRAGQRQNHIKRLEAAMQADGGIIGKLWLSEESLTQKAELNEALDPTTRQKAEKVLADARKFDPYAEEIILQNPAAAGELQAGMDIVGAALQQRVAAMPKRSETSVDDLPPLPELQFETAGNVETTILEVMQEILADGRTEASQSFTEKQPEVAINRLNLALAKARARLDSIDSPAWKADCVKQLDKATIALSEQLAKPYLDALKTAASEAYKTEKWDHVMDLLDALVRLAPKAEKLPAQFKEIDAFLDSLENLDSLEAAVARERFETIRQMLTPGARARHGKRTGVSTSSGKFGEDINLRLATLDASDRSGAIELLVKAVQAWREEDSGLKQLQAERVELLKTVAEDGQDVKDLDDDIQIVQAEMARREQTVRAALAKLDQADRELFNEIQAGVDGFERHRAELKDGRRKLKDGHKEVVDARKEIAALKQRQQPSAAGAARASGTSRKLSVTEIVQLAAGIPYNFQFASPDGLKPGDLRIITVQGIKTRWRWIPPGRFKMGSPTDEKGRDGDEDQVLVTISQGYWMLETEVTQELWAAVMGGSLDWDSYGKGPKHPVYNVSHDEATAFCAKFNTLLKAIPDAADLKARLPTEAEWEFACRAGTTTRYYWGDRDEDANEFAWHEGNSDGTTHPVGQKQPNAWGLLDSSGNVWEWTADWYAAELTGGTVPSGPSSDASLRVDRGGCWGSSVGYGNLRSASRGGNSPGGRISDLGFRMACSSVMG